VQSWNPSGYGPWSDGKNFTTPPAWPIQKPILNSPSGSVGTYFPTYIWNTVTAKEEGVATWYYLWVDGPNGNEVQQWYQASSICSGSTCSVTPSVTLTGGAHTWWVQSWNPSGYGPWSDGKSFTTPTSSGFNSQFNGSTTGWVGRSGSWWNDSSLWYTTTGVPYYWGTSSYNSTAYANFDFQASLYRSGCDYCSNAIVIRGRPDPLASDYTWNYGYHFQYTNDGSYSIWKATGNDTWSWVQSWTDSSAIIPYNWNLLRVTASGNTLYFYINGTLVWAGVDTSFTNGLVGVAMYNDDFSGEQLWVDWATLNSYVKLEDLPVITGTVNSAQQALNDAANAKGGNQDPRRSP
jgi:hypothetical protein